MSRKNLLDYSGARGRIARSDLAGLGSSWVLQPKIDGAYCHVILDNRGRIIRILSRTGAEYSRDLTADLLGQFIGAPDAVLVGELTAHTEAGNREAATVGQRLVHLFDCIRGPGGKYLGRLPYRARRDALYRMQSEVECFGPSLPWFEDDTANRKRDRSSGRFCEGRLSGWRVAPIVPQLAPSRCDDLWGRVEAGELEGVVAVNLDAPVSARRGKLKCKPLDTLDATVVDLDRSTVRCMYAGRSFCVSRGRRELSIGDLVEVAHNGWYEREPVPRFARITRVRHDLMLR